MNVVVLEDINGVLCTIAYDKISDIIMEDGFSLYGMSLTDINDLSKLVRAAGGSFPLDDQTLELRVIV